MKVNERRTVVGGVDWPLCVPPTVERDRRACCLPVCRVCWLAFRRHPFESDTDLRSTQSTQC